MPQKNRVRLQGAWTVNANKIHSPSPSSQYNANNLNSSEQSTKFKRDVVGNVRKNEKIVRPTIISSIGSFMNDGLSITINRISTDKNLLDNLFGKCINEIEWKQCYPNEGQYLFSDKLSQISDLDWKNEMVKEWKDHLNYAVLLRDGHDFWKWLDLSSHPLRLLTLGDFRHLDLRKKLFKDDGTLIRRLRQKAEGCNQEEDEFDIRIRLTTGHSLTVISDSNSNDIWEFSTQKHYHDRGEHIQLFF
ncbi:hypothetical protein SNEBB_002089 [Seison nebaliae]|nr:hypothetical protein SNEBB_002089 [Seison nebaliae]